MADLLVPLEVLDLDSMSPSKNAEFDAIILIAQQ